MLLSRIDRYETYDQNFRRWHWRLGMEQLQFSQQIPRPGSNPSEPLYLSNTKRMLLLCGMSDFGGDLCQDTRDVAPKMEMTPGKALFLKDTGHSIHNERPNYLARQIVDFVDAGSSAHAATSVSASAPLPQLEVAVCETSDGRSCTKTRLPGPAAPGKKFALKARVSVTSDGHPVQGAQVAVEGKSTLTDAGGVAVIGFEVRSELEKAGAEPGAPKPAPHYIWIAPAARVSKTGYEISWAPMPISGN